MKKKLISLLLVATMVVSLAGCGEGNSSSETLNSTDTATESSDTTVDTSTADVTAETDNTTDIVETADEIEEEIEKPEKISIMVDGTMLTQENGRDEFIAKLEELTGITFEVIQPDHETYYDDVTQLIPSENCPDVVILSTDFMADYGSKGLLWDMSKAWENSDLKKRQEAFNGDSVVSSMYIDNHLYGMPATRGNGCLTYVKQAWLDKAGITTLPSNYEEYYDMLIKLKETNGADYVLAAPGFLTTASPYILYLSEFYQDAWPSFYQKADGTWVDGFEEDAMKSAMQRLADAVSDGLIDPKTYDYDTSDIRREFYSDNLGVFTYWAGVWASNLKNNLKNNGLDDELVALPPIKEVSAYKDRVAPTWCITTACENPEGVFKYFIEPMQDGGDVQFLFTYGVEDIHWSTKAETLYEKTENEKVYAEGEFHMKDRLGAPGSQYTTAHIDPMLALTELKNNPYDQIIPQVAIDMMMLFNANSIGDFIIPPTDELIQYNNALINVKYLLISEVAVGRVTIDEAYAEYESEGCTEISKAIVDSLNAR